MIPRIPGATLGELRAEGEFGRSTPGGNPGGFLKIRDFDEELRDFLVTPAKFLGNLAALGPNARFEFDRLHQSAVAAVRPIEVRVFGYGATYRYRGPLPTPGWAHYVAPLDPLRWTVLGGSLTFEETLKAVQRIEVSVDEAMARVETSGLDNFQLLSSAPIVPMFSIAPAELFFRGARPAFSRRTDGRCDLGWRAGAVDGHPNRTVDPAFSTSRHGDRGHAQHDCRNRESGGTGNRRTAAPGDRHSSKGIFGSAARHSSAAGNRFGDDAQDVLRRRRQQRQLYSKRRPRR